MTTTPTAARPKPRDPDRPRGFHDAVHAIRQLAESGKRHPETADMMKVIAGTAEAVYCRDVTQGPPRVGPQLTVGELIELLSQFPDRLPVDVEIPNPHTGAILLADFHDTEASGEVLDVGMSIAGGTSVVLTVETSPW